MGNERIRTSIAHKSVVGDSLQPRPRKALDERIGLLAIVELKLLQCAGDKREYDLLCSNNLSKFYLHLGRIL